MKCPNCGEQIFVKYHHYMKDGSVSRRRVCPSCKHSQTTIEASRSEYLALKRLAQDLRWSVDRYLEGRKRL